MGYFLRSIADEYDSNGNYIGNSDEGNRFHNAGSRPSRDRRIICGGCDSPVRNGNACGNCGCHEQKVSYR